MEYPAHGRGIPSLRAVPMHGTRSGGSCPQAAGAKPPHRLAEPVPFGEWYNGLYH